MTTRSLPSKKHGPAPPWRGRRRPARRRGLSALEVVLTTALIIPSLILFTYFGMQVLRVLFTLIGTMVGSPLL